MNRDPGSVLGVDDRHQGKSNQRFARVRLSLDVVCALLGISVWSTASTRAFHE